MGVLDKFRIRGTVKSRFNPGRNNNWDWNELLTTIETNFEGDFDLADLENKVATNKAAIESNDTDIATNATAIETNATGINANLTKNNVQEVEIATLNAKFAQLCECLSSKVEGWDCPACVPKGK